MKLCRDTNSKGTASDDVILKKFGMELDRAYVFETV